MNYVQQLIEGLKNYDGHARQQALMIQAGICAVCVGFWLWNPLPAIATYFALLVLSADRA